MNYRVSITSKGFVGTVCCQMCSSSGDAQRPIFGNIDFPISWFEEQIPLFDYPVLVLSDITMETPRNGNGRQTMRALHHWAADRGALFVFLRIGTQGDEYCHGVLWRRRFYKSEGWVSLRRPQLQGLVHHWMYRKLDPMIDPLPDSQISFEKYDRIPAFPIPPMPIKTASMSH